MQLANKINQEKLLTHNETDIVVTHITIRQSISILLFRSVLLEVLAATTVILFHTIVISTNIVDIAHDVNQQVSLFNIPFFLLLVVIKTCLLIVILVQWVNEYYEITPTEVIHRKGLLFKKEERYSLDHIGSVKIEQGIFGRIFNYGTVKMYDWATEERFALYLIHNPMKYHQILQTLLPQVDKEKKVLREYVLEPEEV